MPLYRAAASQFRAQVLDNSLTLVLVEQYGYQIGQRPSPGEVRAWERSLHVLSADLVQAGLDDVEVLVEHQLPLTSKRADVVLCGVHPTTGEPSYVVVELKQWSDAHLLEDSTELCSVPGSGGTRLHPAEQVRRYCGHLEDFLATLEDLRDPLAGVAYLHNATDLSVADLFDLPEDAFGRLFTGQRRGQFLDYLQTRLAPGVRGAEAADRLLGSAVRPSRQLLALAAEEVQTREVFRLQAEQQVAYSLVLRALERSRRGAHKQAVVVVGGPGSGKSVIALSLLG
ncbi:MAG: binding protein, partial [Frankiales bacterium]|nr:binding protein [Frankiales bacterium]